VCCAAATGAPMEAAVSFEKVVVLYETIRKFMDTHLMGNQHGSFSCYADEDMNLVFAQVLTVWTYIPFTSIHSCWPFTAIGYSPSNRIGTSVHSGRTLY